MNLLTFKNLFGIVLSVLVHVMLIIATLGTEDVVLYVEETSKIAQNYRISYHIDTCYQKILGKSGFFHAFFRLSARSAQGSIVRI